MTTTPPDNPYSSPESKTGKTIAPGFSLWQAVGAHCVAYGLLGGILGYLLALNVKSFSIWDAPARLKPIIDFSGALGSIIGGVFGLLRGYVRAKHFAENVRELREKREVLLFEAKNTPRKSSPPNAEESSQP